MTEPDRKPPDHKTVVIRALRPDDAVSIAAIRGLPGVRNGTLAIPFPTAEASRKWIESRPPGNMEIVAEADGAVIGEASLERHHGRRGHCAGLGIMVHDDHQGRGVGTALFAALTDAADRWLGVLRLELTVFADNAPALALYRRFGFIIEGRLCGHAFRDGRYVDAFAVARLAGALAPLGKS